jgi:Alpha/beta hydrolase domain
MSTIRIAVVAAAVTLCVSTLSGQIGGGPAGGGFPGGGRGRAGGAPPANLPETPTAVALPTLSAEITGPGPMFDSSPSLWPGKGLAAFNYETHEYFVSGTANGEPYTTRLVVRKPADNSKFSGLVLAEAMHGSGAAHMFEFTSIYTMSSGHAAVEILTTPPAQFVALNEARYRNLKLNGMQTNEILAQVGALVRSGTLVGGSVRKMVLGGTSMTAGVLINYLPAHMVYRTPQMQRVYDGFLPMSNGAMIRDVDVPMIHVPTMHEVSGNITNKQDSDEPGKQYRLYEFSGMGHIDTRDSVRLKPNPCADPLSTFPVQAYMSVALDHLLKWVDKGTVPPRAPRILLDRDQSNDGSMMALDQYGNPQGGIRTVYVDVPTAKYVIRPAALNPVVANAAPYIAAGGQNAANLMCGLSTAQIAFAPAKLKELYKSKQGYVKSVETRLSALEKSGWSLPLYRDMILSDAAKVNF